MISSQSEGLGKMALGIVKIFLGSPFSPISIVRDQVVCGQLVCDQFVAFSCHGPEFFLATLSYKHWEEKKKKEINLIAAKSGLVAMKGYLKTYNPMKYFLPYLSRF